MNGIWYASYGSNLLKDRFYCYIKGGTPWGTKKEYTGCRNKKLPSKIEEFFINGEIYFAKKSSTWNGGGVAFLDTSPNDVKTLSRIYLITEDQFIDVVKQENGGKEIELNFDEARQNGSSQIKNVLWYNNLIYLGDKDGFPIFTFTHNDLSYINEINKPTKSYLKIIIEGLKETSNYNDNEDIIEYLNTKKGILDHFTNEELLELLLEDFNF